MYPIMGNHIQKICLFPIKSTKHPDTLWFNPVHLKRTIGIMRNTNRQVPGTCRMLTYYTLYLIVSAFLKSTVLMISTTPETVHTPSQTQPSLYPLAHFDA